MRFLLSQNRTKNTYKRAICDTFNYPLARGCNPCKISHKLSFRSDITQLGMASVVQTVSCQAYGAKRYSEMDIICQRAIVLHLGAAVLFTVIYYYLHGVDPSAICPMQRFLQAQNIVNPLAYMSGGRVFLLHTLRTWIVVYVLDYDLLGAALTLSLLWWILVLLNALYIVLSPSCKETWTGLLIRVLTGIWPYFKLTVAYVVMLRLDIWYLSGLVLLAGVLSNPTIELDSMSICMNNWNWDIKFMLGLSAAASVQVGNELGAFNPRVAKFSVVIMSATTILISIVLTTIVLIFRVGLSKLFTSDEEVIDAVSDLTPLLPISVNGIQPILSGVAIGSEWQAVVAYLNLTAYYVGIWWGMIIGVVLQTATLIILTARTNWNNEVIPALYIAIINAVSNELGSSSKLQTLSLCT
ncbi:hypothetical protein ACJRO7_002053 [Eucalyptus globulus]|uniref:MATE efflux family protein n=1 Tax=Eucalyptus globulus TaxID=34317 RepID=A0ABD3M2Y7_EUCGL